MSISIVDLAEQTSQLRRPFELAEVAQLDELGVYVYLSHGRFGWHRHVDEDELFLVLNGMVTLDSEWGSVTLHAGEMVLVPKGVGHRSASAWPSHVLLARPKLLASSQNGHRRLFAPPGEELLHKVTVNRAAATIATDFTPTPVANVGAYEVALRRGIGFSTWEQLATATLLLAHLGRIMVEAPTEQASLSAGHLAVLAPHTSVRLAAAGDCVLLQFQRQDRSAALPPALA
jgi:mannose-6-phosphate isomerase-like protein (cupin superfamily)